MTKNPALSIDTPSSYIAHALAKTSGPTHPRHWQRFSFYCGKHIGRLEFYSFRPIQPEQRERVPA